MRANRPWAVPSGWLALIALPPLLLLPDIGPAADAAPDFARDILPVFEEKCLRCHGAKRRDGKLDMRTLDALLKGGATGPAFEKGNATKSLLIELIHYREMPPKKEKPKVTADELALLRRWIDAMPPDGAGLRP